MIAFIKRLFKNYGFHRKPAPQKREYFSHIPSPTDAQLVRWGEAARCIANDPAYLASVARQQLNMTPAAVKARRLAEIARQRNAIKDEIAKAMRQKKSTSPMYHALRALKVEELKVEGQW
jgi:hypothetical protein